MKLSSAVPNNTAAGSIFPAWQIRKKSDKFISLLPLSQLLTVDSASSKDSARRLVLKPFCWLSSRNLDPQSFQAGFLATDRW